MRVPDLTPVRVFRQVAEGQRRFGHCFDRGDTLTLPLAALTCVRRLPPSASDRRGLHQPKFDHDAAVLRRGTVIARINPEPRANAYHGHAQGT
jgi:hypothetical protein